MSRRINKTWVFALAVSLAVHTLIIISIPSAAPKTQLLPVMTVRLVSAQKPPQPVSSPKAGAPAATKKESPKEKVIKSVKKSEAKTKKVASLPVKNLSAATAETKKEVLSSALEAENGSAAEAGGGALSEGSAGGEGGAAGGVGGTGSGEIIDGALLKVTKKTLPDYPLFSRKRKEEGTVVLIITIDKKAVVKTEIEQSSGHERLDLSATRAVKAWRFDHEGRVRARIPFSFKLK